MILLATILAITLGAPDLGPFHLQPWRNVVPDWFEALGDSIPDGRSVELATWSQDSSGQVLYFDTLNLRTDGAFRHTVRTIRTTGTPPGVTLSRSTIHRATGMIDSLDERSWEAGNATAYAVGHRLFPEWAPTPSWCPEVWFQYEGTRPSDPSHSDTAQLRRERVGTPCPERRGHFLSRRIRSHGALGARMATDSVVWDGSNPVLWIETDSGSTGEVSARHNLQWDNSRLIRDSVVRRSRGTDTLHDSSSVITCQWVGSSLRSCLLDGDTAVAIDLDGSGRPIRELDAFFDAAEPALQAWAWDGQGRLAAHTWLTWGDQEPRFSRVQAHYPDHATPWPDSLKTLRCTSLESDSCRLVEVKVFTPPTFLTSGVAPHVRAGKTGPRLLSRGSNLELLGAPAEAALLVLHSLSGRKLGSYPVSSGHLSLTAPATSHLVVWTLTSATGTPLASGRIFAHNP